MATDINAVKLIKVMAFSLLVVIGGALMATVFTVVIVPVAYYLMAKSNASPNAVLKQLSNERLLEDPGEVCLLEKP